MGSIVAFWRALSGLKIQRTVTIKKSESKSQHVSKLSGRCSHIRTHISIRDDKLVFIFKIITLDVRDSFCKKQTTPS
jgi:hypothetical protein